MLKHRVDFRDEMIEMFVEKAGELYRLINPVFIDNLFDQAVDRFRIFGYSSS